MRSSGSIASYSGSNRSRIQEKLWSICGEVVPRDEVVFFAQTIILYVVIVVCLVNVSIGSENQSVFIGLLSSSLGYMLPNPTLGKKDIYQDLLCGKKKQKDSEEECIEVLPTENVTEESVDLSNTLNRSTNNQTPV